MKQKTQKITKAVGYVKGKSVDNLLREDLEGLKNISAVILLIVGVSGLFALSIIAPNVIGAIGKLSRIKFKSSRWNKQEKNQKMVQAFYYLKKSGLIRFRKTPKEIFVFLTKLGKARAKKISFGIMRVKKSDKWDKKWWLIAADIPTKTHRGSADLFRKKLKEMGFYTLQRTLWLYPYDPVEEIQFIAEHYGIQKYITAMCVEKVDKEDEARLTAHFKNNRIL